MSHVFSIKNTQVDTITSGGTSATVTKFEIADGTDLGTLFGKLDTVSQSVSGSGNILTDVTVTVNGKNIAIAKIRGTVPTGYCSYCTHCGYCTYCQCASSYCEPKYCSTCGCSNDS